MGDKIKLRRGLKTNLPVLDDGEFGFATDTNQTYIGNSGTNILMNNPQASIYEVSPNGPYTSIQTAINQAVTDGHTGNGNPAFILIQPGTYTENLSFKPGVHLIGNGSKIAPINGNPLNGIPSEIKIVGTATYNVSNANGRASNTVNCYNLKFTTINGVVFTISGNSALQVQFQECALEKQSGGDSNAVFSHQCNNSTARVRFIDTNIFTDVATTPLDLQRGVTEFRGRHSGIASNITLPGLANLSNAASFFIGLTQSFYNGSITSGNAAFNINSSSAVLILHHCVIQITSTGSHFINFTANGFARARNCFFVLGTDNTSKIATGTTGTVQFADCSQIRSNSNSNNSSDPSVSFLSEGVFGGRRYSDGIQRLKVGGSSGYPTIQAALDDIHNSTLSSSKWLVSISPGVYPENLTFANNSKSIILTNDTNENGIGPAPVVINGKVTINNTGTVKFINIQINQYGSDYAVECNSSSFNVVAFDNSSINKTGSDTLEVIKNNNNDNTLIVLNKSILSSLNVIRKYITINSSGFIPIGLTKDDLYYRYSGNYEYVVNSNAINDSTINAFSTIQQAIDEASQNTAGIKFIRISNGTYTENLNFNVASTTIILEAISTNLIEPNIIPVKIDGYATINQSCFVMANGIYFENISSDNAIFDIQSNLVSLNLKDCFLYRDGLGSEPVLKSNSYDDGGIYLNNCKFLSLTNSNRRLVVVGTTNTFVTGLTPNDLFYRRSLKIFYRVDKNNSLNTYANIASAIEESSEFVDERVIEIFDGDYTEDLTISGPSNITLISKNESEYVNGSLAPVKIEGTVTISAALNFTARGINFKNTLTDAPVIDIQAPGTFNFVNCLLLRDGSGSSPIIKNDTVSGADVFLTNAKLASWTNLDRRFSVVGGTGNSIIGKTPSDMYSRDGSAAIFKVNRRAEFSPDLNSYPKISVAIEEADIFNGFPKIIKITPGFYTEDLNFNNAEEFHVTGIEDFSAGISDPSVVVSGKTSCTLSNVNLKFKNIGFLQTGNDNLFYLNPSVSTNIVFENCLLIKMGSDSSALIDNTNATCSVVFNKCRIISSVDPATSRVMLDMGDNSVTAIDSEFLVNSAAIEQNHVLINAGNNFYLFLRCNFFGSSENLFHFTNSFGFFSLNSCNINASYERGQLFFFDSGASNYGVNLLNSFIGTSNFLNGGLFARKGTQATAFVKVVDNTFDSGDKITVNGVDFTYNVDWVAGATITNTVDNIVSAINSSLSPNIVNKTYALADGDYVKLYSVVYKASSNSLTLDKTDNATTNFELSGSSVQILNNSFDAGDKLTINGVDFTYNVDWVAGVSSNETVDNIVAAINSSTDVNIQGLVFAIADTSFVNKYVRIFAITDAVVTVSETDNATDNFNLTSSTFYRFGADGPANTFINYSQIGLTLNDIQNDIGTFEFNSTLNSV